MTKKYSLKKLLAKFAERTPADRENVRYLYDDDKKELRVETVLPGVKEFERRKFRFGTPEESWAALHIIAKAIEAGEPVPAVPGAWLLAALNTMGEDDPKELVKALGFVENGRARVVNKFNLVERMVHLVEQENLPKISAARVCAGEFGCHHETALYWYRKKNEVFPIK